MWSRSAAGGGGEDVEVAIVVVAGAASVTEPELAIGGVLPDLPPSSQLMKQARPLVA
jgi:hypothetical protein